MVVEPWLGKTEFKFFQAQVRLPLIKLWKHQYPPKNTELQTHELVRFNPNLTYDDDDKSQII